MAEKDLKLDFDIIIVGAGISGINTAYRLQTLCPDLSFTILEGRDKIGGTWDLFKYPGIRSDSDLYTFGFAWEHWTEPNPIAEAGSILAYLNHCVQRYGIDKKIQFQTKVDKLDWSSSEQRWLATVSHNDTTTTYRARYIVMGTGYYDYTTPPEIRVPGLSNFTGEVIHPQFWPSSCNYTDKRVAIIGSGATTVTLVPAMAKTAKMVTQVQRSPTYYFVKPQLSPSNERIKRYLPTTVARRIIRLNAMLISLLFYTLCQLFPHYMRRVLQNKVRDELPPHVPVNPHFKPLYNPWDQRMCLTPDGDYFAAFRANTASIVTGTIKTVTASGITMQSGEHIDADIIITATGLRLQFGGNIAVSVDGLPISIPEQFMWKGVMFSDVPNVFYMFGYANASWTLGADNSIQLAIRLIRLLQARGYKSATPRLAVAEAEAMDRENISLLPLSSTYVANAMDKSARTMPRAGRSGNWRRKSNHFRDLWEAKFGDIVSGLVFR